MSDSRPLVLGNLDCEARWAGVTLPRRVQERISAAATLLRFLFDEPIALWTPAPVDPQRVLAVPESPVPHLVSGPPPRAAHAAWAAFAGRRLPAPRDRYQLGAPAPLAVATLVNDRRFAAALERELHLAIPGACEIRSSGELAEHLARGGAAASPTGQWLCKAPLTAAGRDRVLGQGPLDERSARAVTRLLARFSVLLFEPYLERVADLGVCAVATADEVIQRVPHTLLTSARGGFLGIRTGAPPLTNAHREELTRVVDHAGRALAAAGYHGPFAVDAFLHRALDGQLQLRALCEINARLSFGWIAAALAERLGTRELGFSAEPPAGATVLVGPATDDAAAWVR